MAPKDVARVVDVTSLPEMPSLERWSRVDDMPVVDIDHRRTPDALARVARRLDVDAVAAVHHVWWLSYDRSQILRTTYLTDRCTVVLVDRDGVVLWRDTASARAVVRTALAMPSPSSLGPTGTVGELTRLARQTGRMASAELTATVMRLPPLPPGPAVRTREPPPPLHGPTTP